MNLKCNVISRLGKLGLMLLVLTIAFSCSNPLGEVSSKDDGKSSRGTATAQASDPWKAWESYSTGAIVAYDGVAYKCIQAHTSQPDWTPVIVPALWVVYPGTVQSLPYIKPWADNEDYVEGQWVDYNNNYFYATSDHSAQVTWNPPAATSLWRSLPAADVQPDDVEILFNGGFNWRVGGWPTEGANSKFYTTIWHQSGLSATYGKLKGKMYQDITSKLDPNTMYQLKIGFRSVEESKVRISVEQKSGGSWNSIASTGWVVITAKGEPEWFTGADGRLHQNPLSNLQYINEKLQTPSNVSGDLRFVVETDLSVNDELVHMYNLGFERYNFIKADGNKLVNGGKVFKFEAIAFTNHYHDDSPAGGTYPTFSDLKHHRQEDFDELKKMGFNTIRFALNADWFNDNPNPSTDPHGLWSWIEESVTMADNAGLYIVLEMHQPPGSTWLNAADVKDLTTDIWVWNDPVKQAKLVEIWTEIATVYKDDPRVAAYGLLNEPKTTDLTGEAWFGSKQSDEKDEHGMFQCNDDGLADRMIQAVRAIDTNHLLLIDNFSGDLRYADDDYDPELVVWHKLFNDDNLVYDMHYYYEGTYTHKGALWGGGQDNGSWYPDPYMVHNQTYLDKHKQTSDWRGVAKTEDQTFDDGVWERHYTTVVDGDKWGMITPVLEVDAKTDMTIEGEIYFDNFFLQESRDGENWYNIRENFIKGDWADEAQTYTNDGFYFYDWMSVEEPGKTPKDYAEYIINPVGSDLEGSDGNISYGFTNIINGDHQYQAVDWEQSWTSKLRPKKGYKYRAVVDIMITGDVSSDNCSYYGPKINVYKGAKVDGNEFVILDDGSLPEAWYGFDRDYLEEKMFIINFYKNTFNKPISVFEFGLMEVCYTDRENGESYGGTEWMRDIKRIFNKHDISYATWAFRNWAMGMFNYEDYGDYVTWDEDWQINPGIYSGIEALVY